MSPHERILVVGTSGSGKTTLARALARRLGLRHVELDGLRHQAGWTTLPDEAFRALVREAADDPLWVVDGNYSIAQDLLWPRATTLVWLDLPLGLTLARLLRRTLRRWWHSEVLWNGNRERLLAQLGWNGLFLWALRTRRRLNQAYSGVSEKAPHVTVVRLRSPAEVAAWLESLGPSGGDTG